MDEYLIVWQATSAGLALVAASCLYSLGGRSGKWKRRFVASFVLASAITGIALWRGIFDWWFLLTYPILSIGFLLGYGADSTGIKILKRTIYAVTVISAGLVFCFVLGGKTWLVLIPHAGIGLWSVFMGVKNPIAAAAEEFFICMILNIGLMMYLFI